jgi:holo-[acyl-carrier protein] synthase
MIVGIGFDLESIARIEAMLERFGQRALDRLFTPSEQSYANARGRPAMHYAARFAAKEAAFKALAGSGEAHRIGWKDIEVQREDRRPPAVRFFGGAAKRALALGVVRAHLTLSHTQDTAGAVIILEGTPPL